MLRENNSLIYLCLSFLLLKILSIFLTNFDLFGDEAQYWLWSKDIDFGYYSKPPFLSWIVGVVCYFFGDSFFVIKMIPVITYCLTTFIIYQISLKLFKDAHLALLTAVSFFLMPAVTVSSFLLSTDIFLILFWSLALLQILIIIEKPVFLNFIVLGIFVGIGLLTKYAGVYFIICFPFLLFEKKFRMFFYSKWIFFVISFLVSMIVLAPNIFWNLKNDWNTLSHTTDNASLDKMSISMFDGIVFLASQIIIVGPLIFASYVFYIRKGFEQNFNTIFLLSFSFPIFFIILVESILVRANANWAAVSLISFLLLFVELVYRFNKKIIYLNSFVNLLFGIVFFISIAISSPLPPFKRISGISEFVLELKNSNNSFAKNVVLSDRMLFSNASYILKDKGINIYTPYAPNNKINHHFQKTRALPESFNEKFLFVGHLSEISYLKNIFEALHLETKVVGFTNEKLNIYEIIF